MGSANPLCSAAGAPRLHAQRTGHSLKPQLPAWACLQQAAQCSGGGRLAAFLQLARGRGLQAGGAGGTTACQSGALATLQRQTKECGCGSSAQHGCSCSAAAPTVTAEPHSFQLS